MIKVMLHLPHDAVHPVGSLHRRPWEMMLINKHECVPGACVILGWSGSLLWDIREIIDLLLFSKGTKKLKVEKIQVIDATKNKPIE